MITWTTLVIVLLLSVASIVTGLFLRLRKEKSFIGAALVFTGLVAAGHLIPFVLFPWPTLSAKGGTHGWHNILTMRAAIVIDVIQWIFATAIFAYSAARVRALFLVPLAFSAIAVLAVAVVVAVRAAGFNFYWELWR